MDIFKATSENTFKNEGYPFHCEKSDGPCPFYVRDPVYALCSDMTGHLALFGPAVSRVACARRNLAGPPRFRRYGWKRAKDEPPHRGCSDVAGMSDSEICCQRGISTGRQRHWKEQPHEMGNRSDICVTHTFSSVFEFLCLFMWQLSTAYSGRCIW